MPDFDTSEQKKVTGSWKNGNEISGFKKFRDFLEQLTDC